MFISEIYESIQGEGPWTGRESLFVRTSGCNLRCWFCDTPYTSWKPEGNQWSLEQLNERIRRAAADHVVITGGEPMLAAEISELTELCRTARRTITIETAGTVDRSVECDLMAISPKRPNSVPDEPPWRERHEETRHQPAVVWSLLARYNGILKFVIDSEKDVDDVIDYLQEFPDVSADQVWLMPQAVTPEELAERSSWVQAAAEDHGFRYSNRLHIQKFGNIRGK